MVRTRKASLANFSSPPIEIVTLLTNPVARLLETVFVSEPVLHETISSIKKTHVGYRSSIPSVQNGWLLDIEKVDQQIMPGKCVVENTYRNTDKATWTDLTLLWERFVIRPVHDTGG